MSQGKCVVFSAPSGSGKSTLAKHLLAQPACNLAFSISATSRPPRGNEEHGKDYYFLSEAAFKEKIAQGAFVEYEEVYPGMFYGTLKSELERIWSLGLNALFDIDAMGGISIKKRYPTNTLAIFIKPPTIDVLSERLNKRGTDSEEKIALRLAKATSELAHAPAFDHVVVNDDLATAKKEVTQLAIEFLQA